MISGEWWVHVQELWNCASKRELFLNREGLRPIAILWIILSVLTKFVDPAQDGPDKGSNYRKVV